MTIYLHKGDLPDDVSFTSSVAVDSETMGLNPHRDQLCLVQLSAGDGDAHLVQLDRKTYDAPNLKNLMQDESIEKIFHFAPVLHVWHGNFRAIVFSGKYGFLFGMEISEIISFF